MRSGNGSDGQQPCQGESGRYRRAGKGKDEHSYESAPHADGAAPGRDKDRRDGNGGDVLRDSLPALGIWNMGLRSQRNGTDHPAPGENPADPDGEEPCGPFIRMNDAGENGLEHPRGDNRTLQRK